MSLFSMHLTKRRLLIVCVLCIASSCRENKNCPEGAHDAIRISNNSLRSVNLVWEDSQDSIYTVNGTRGYEVLIRPSTTYYHGAGLDKCYEVKYKHKDNTYAYFFLFDDDTIKKIGWDAINGTDRGLLKKVRVNREYLDNNDYSITYP